MTDRVPSEPPSEDPSDPYSRQAQIFPTLPPDMAARIEGYGTEERLVKGTLVFQRGQRSVDFFFVKEGTIEVLDVDDHGQPQIFATHGAGQFTGELDLFNDRQILATGRVGVDSTVIRVKRADFRRLVSGEPDIGEVLMRAFILRRMGFISHAQGGVAIIGKGHGADTLRLQRFLSRNAYPFRLLDTEVDPDAGGFLACFELTANDLPVVVATTDRSVLRNPSNAALADQLGLTEQLDPTTVFDVVVIGAGPAGLAAAVYGASEGLSTLVIEGMAPGGQAGTSSKIENYLGFPTGISGQALAGRAQVQAQKFGARLAISRGAVALDCAHHPYKVTLEGGSTVSARALVVATGARYRKLDVPNYDRFEGQGIHYAATGMERQLCVGEDVIVVGGGNSAGQAALFLSRTARVHLLVRASGFAATMSDYLVQRIAISSRITMRPRTEIVALQGDGLLRSVTWQNRDTAATETHTIGNVFVMIGAEPNTEWLQGCLALDDKGFIKTGQSDEGQSLASPYATTKPGIYAVGDVRAGSVKRVAASVGEGSVVVQAIHTFLSQSGAH